MAYISLYRKYRPKSFAEVVGQEVVVKILKNSITNNKIGHAYIFSGPRGTGKTSIAKIFSKAVNCLSNKDGDLCGKCDVCKLNFDDEIDIIEIDAASNNGVDEIREIRNNVKLMPSHLKYKVYIIDEVHMLSTSAFNALLKTLEEPPKNIIFILATTEFNKIPATVVSRCQKFDFKKLTNKQIIDRLKYILKKEEKKLDDEVIELISNLSDGGMRDAINMLDQVLSLEKDIITVDDVYYLVGDTSEETIFNLLDNIISGDIKELLKCINILYEEGKNFVNISDRLQMLIRNIIIFCNTKKYFTKEYEEKLSKYSNIEIDLLLKLSEEIFKLINDIKKTTNQKIIMEIYSIKMTLLFRNIEKEEKKEIKQEEIIEKKIEKEIETSEESNQMKDIKINNALSAANKELKEEFLNKYIILNEYVSNKEYNSLANLLLKAIPEVVSNKNIIFTFKNKLEIVLFDKNEEDIQKFLKKIYGKNYSIVAITNEEWLKIREEYISNTKKGIKYEYIEEKLKSKNAKKNTELENTVEDLFGEELIKVD
ncbi:MAG: DNA polymerase III subunit gamma/tau [Bacilli bacterium]|nr:DNA polymerase III subunit gamma/tau [Bacilli bacterium]